MLFLPLLYSYASFSLLLFFLDCLFCSSSAYSGVLTGLGDFFSIYASCILVSFAFRIHRRPPSSSRSRFSCLWPDSAPHCTNHIDIFSSHRTRHGSVFVVYEHNDTNNNSNTALSNPSRSFSFSLPSRFPSRPKLLPSVLFLSCLPFFEERS